MRVMSFLLGPLKPNLSKLGRKWCSNILIKMSLLQASSCTCCLPDFAFLFLVGIFFFFFLGSGHDCFLFSFGFTILLFIFLTRQVR